MERPIQPQIIHLRCPAPQAFDFANLSQEYGRACTLSLQEALLRRSAPTAAGPTPSPDDDPTRHLAVVAAHFARRALGER